jgi:hypothetical protein
MGFGPLLLGFAISNYSLNLTPSVPLLLARWGGWVVAVREPLLEAIRTLRGKHH